MHRARECSCVGPRAEGKRMKAHMLRRLRSSIVGLAGVSAGVALGACGRDVAHQAGSDLGRRRAGERAEGVRSGGAVRTRRRSRGIRARRVRAGGARHSRAKRRDMGRGPVARPLGGVRYVGRPDRWRPIRCQPARRVAEVDAGWSVPGHGCPSRCADGDGSYEIRRQSVEGDTLLIIRRTRLQHLATAPSRPVPAGSVTRLDAPPPTRAHASCASRSRPSARASGGR